MAIHYQLLSLLFIFLSTDLFLYSSEAAAKYLLPIIKDESKGQYYTRFTIGNPSVTVQTAIGTGNRYSWIACDIVGYTNSSTFRPIKCDTAKCDAYGEGTCTSCIQPGYRPSCTEDTCGALVHNPLSAGGGFTSLIQDTISIFAGNPRGLSKASLPEYPLTCSHGPPLVGLSPHTKGVLTLAKTPVAIQYQVSSSLKVPNKFALCLPSKAGWSSSGAIYFGGGPYYLPPRRNDLSAYLVKIPLVTNPNSTAPYYSEGEPSIEYFIKVRSIKVEGKPVRFSSSLLSFDNDGVGGTKLDTLTSYTQLHTHIYKALLHAYTLQTDAMKIKRVKPVAPFGACFDSRTIGGTTRTGPNVPFIDLIMENKSPVLHKKNARWRIYGAQSLVSVSRDVSCLAFVDGGSSPRTSIVIGGKQMEDTLVEVDLESSNLGVTSSLLHLGTSCSQFNGRIINKHWTWTWYSSGAPGTVAHGSGSGP